jgi:hypothetical protein
MSGWGNATRQGGWNQGGWRNVRRGEAGLPRAAGRWSAPDVAVMVVAFIIRWELGLAFLGLKLWQQASGYQGSVFAFAAGKWEALVGATRALLHGGALPFSVGSFSVGLGTRSTGNKAFDTWRQGELARIEAERDKLRIAEREFTAYRDELLHVKDREDFDRFMQTRGPSA